MPRIPIELRAPLSRVVRWRFAVPLLAALTFSFGAPIVGTDRSLERNTASASPLGSSPAQRGGPPDGVPNGPPAGVPPGPPDGVPNGPPAGLPPAGLGPLVPSTTPELDSIALFGAGAAGMAGYVLMRVRGMRRRD